MTEPQEQGDQLRPDDQVQQDDMLQQDDQISQNENDDQRSQQDIHSNGFDETNEPIGETDETAQASQAYDAAEPAYTLNVDAAADRKEDNNDNEIGLHNVKND